MDENTIVEKFVDTIKNGVTGLKTIRDFEGNMDDAVKQLLRYPSVLVLLENIKYQDGDESGDLLEGTPIVSLLIGNRSLRNKSETRKGAYQVMKDCRELLHNSAVGMDNATWKVIDQRLADTTSSINVFIQRYQGFNVYFN